MNELPENVSEKRKRYTHVRAAVRDHFSSGDPTAPDQIAIFSKIRICKPNGRLRSRTFRNGTFISAITACRHTTRAQPTFVFFNKPTGSVFLNGSINIRPNRRNCGHGRVSVGTTVAASFSTSELGFESR